MPTASEVAPASPLGERRQIPALTGVRIFAVLAVVLTHVHDSLRFLIGDPYKPLEFFSYHGWLAVELFFLLSGFTLTHAYGHRLGQRIGAADYGRFVWRRVARLWPVFAVTLLLTMVAMGTAAALQLDTAKARTPLDTGFFFQQISMTWMWFRDDAAVPAAWNGPSWYVSVEFLACVAFPFLILLVHRIAGRVSTGWVAGLLLLTVTPYVMIEFYYSSGPTPFSSMLRVATFFGAGMLLRVLVARVPDDSGPGADLRQRASRPRASRPRASRPRWWAELLAPVALVVLLVTMWVDYHLLPNREVVYVVVPFVFCALVAGLYLARGSVTWLCSTRWAVALGRISYGIFLGHGLLLIVREYLIDSGRLGPDSGPILVGLAVAAYGVGSIALGYLLWRHVEEPAGAAMNAMLSSSTGSTTQR